MPTAESMLKISEAFFTIFLTCCYQLDAKLANLEAAVEVEYYSEVSFCNNSTVTRAQ